MSDVECNAAEVLVGGLACRLPGAPSVGDFWRVLVERRCTIGEIGAGRWPRTRYLHPRQGEAGKTYTMRAGTLEAPWDFDPAAFGISPREAEQIDPQQRLLLELVWEALEDAGVPPSRLAGRAVGVYVGASSVDHANRRVLDPAGGDAYQMTGSALSLIANRISYCFDFAGPSLVVDTACSSSLVAMHEAVTALRTGQIECAIVAGVNALLAPFPFLGFAHARMLSPEGLCRSFGANGQGYVRSEGGVALLLYRQDSIVAQSARPHARVVASGVNSDGRTAGVSLPSYTSQAALLRRVYAEAGIDPERLAFVEAHGTGTRVGDPIEARAVGEELGQKRSAPLPIGSAKSNVGHLEPASGLVGLLKATLALAHDVFPPSLHSEELNPDIPFDALNLHVAREPVAIDHLARPRLAGVSTFGFGGTNAHVVIADADAPVRESRTAPAAPAPDGAALGLLVTAHGEPALVEAAARLGDVLQSAEGATAQIGQALAHHRERLPERAVVLGAPAPGLAALAAGRPHDAVVRGRAIATEAPVAFVYSGNGSQWAGMGRAALESDPVFRDRIALVDDAMKRQAGWSVAEALAQDDLAERLGSTIVAQPLLFAIQAAATDTLRAYGVTPDFVIGHSVGEVAAAYGAGHFDLEEAVRLVLARSASQEFARGTGRMAVLHVARTVAEALLERLHATDVEIAAVNSSSSVTLVGSEPALNRVLAEGQAAGLKGQLLEIEYPFHSRLMDGARDGLLTGLADLAPRRGHATFVSTVTGTPVEADALGAEYWWRNVRLPVQFADGVAQAATLGAGVFIEIGPRPVLRTYLDQCLRAAGQSYAVLTTLARNDTAATDALRRAAAGAITRGARFDVARAFGPKPAAGSWRRLPSYAWQRVRLADTTTSEAVGGVERVPDETTGDGLIGFRVTPDVPVWHSHLDTLAFPELADHKVAGKPWLPAAAFADLALAAGQQWLGAAHVEVRDLDITRPLVLSADGAMDVRTSIDVESATCEIASRPRLSDDPWQVHARCRISAPTDDAVSPVIDDAVGDAGHAVTDAATVYACASRVGLDYGPAFRRMARVVHAAGDQRLRVDLDRDAPTWPRTCVLSPSDFDSVFHGLFSLLEGDRPELSGKAFIPVRLGRIRVLKPATETARAVVSGLRLSRHALKCDIAMLDAEGSVVALVDEARFVATQLVSTTDTEHATYRFTGRRTLDVQLSGAAQADAAAMRAAVAELAPADAMPSEEAALLLDAAAQRVAFDVLAAATEPGAVLPRIAADDPRAIALAVARAGDLVVPHDAGWQPIEPCPLPPLSEILGTVLAEHPDWIADCALLADIGAALRSGSAWSPLSATWRHFRHESPRASAARELVQRAVMSVLATWPAGRPLRVLQLGGDDLAVAADELPALVARGRLRLVVADDRATVLQALEAGLAPRLIETVSTAGDAARDLAARGPFDLVVGFHALHALLDTPLMPIVRAAMGGSALLFAVEPRPGPFNDLVLGALAGDARALRLPDAQLWADALARAGIEQVATSERSDLTGMWLVTGVAAATGLAGAVENDAHVDGSDAAVNGVPAAAADKAARTLRIVTIEGGKAAGLARQLAARQGNGAAHPHVNGHAEANGASAPAVDHPADVVVLAGTGSPIAEPTRHVADAIEQLKGLLACADSAPRRVWIVAPGGARHHIGEGAACPVATAIWALARTVANENAQVDVRMVDVAPGIDEAVQAGRILALVGAPGDEKELILTGDGSVGLRAVPGFAPPAEGDGVTAEATCLELRRPGSLQTLQWQPAARRLPADGEVEIAVASAGLNFRDVMWAMGMLPAEALEDGFAGPTVGFECSGHVVRVGAGVEHVGVGDRVFAMAPAALASHVTVSADAVARIPDHVDLDAAATVPVAFLTAFYALDRLARLRKGEWVLIHGGAGGVGLAALQIAQAKGARTIVTAGTREKRELLRLLGADHVLSSRSLKFYDEVRALVPEGVEVVLNSLAGEAMERSLELVRPFGRFLELGKRDYYENTKIALRPFRRNVSYFGIDVDQLMRHDPQLARDLMQELVDQLADGSLRPLPFRRFAPGQLLDAFRLMQQSGHIGKILVVPPAPSDMVMRREHAPFSVSGDGAHLVIGGLGGFGLATAAWLVEHGARTLVLLSRGGKPAADGEAAIDALRAQGVTVLVEACDASDAAAVEALLARVRAGGHTIRGVYHCAMVIEDGALANLSREAVERVLKPKIDGARHFDRATRTDPIEHFFLYSSATTLFGNPGQASYVAANGYLEGLAAARRAAGLPARAVAWGAIADAGYLARNERSAALLQSRTGVIAMGAREALRHLDAALAASDDAVLTIAPVDWQAMARLLPVLSSPTFEALAAAGDSAASGEGGPDLAAEIAGLDDGEARAVIVRHLVSLIATIMRAPPGSIDVARPLVDMGIDSLMTVELQAGSKERFGTELPLGALMEGATVDDLATRMLQRLRSSNDTSAAAVDDLVAMHTDKAAAAGEGVASAASM